MRRKQGQVYLSVQRLCLLLGQEYIPSAEVTVPDLNHTLCCLLSDLHCSMSPCLPHVTRSTKACWNPLADSGQIGNATLTRVLRLGRRLGCRRAQSAPANQ